VHPGDLAGGFSDLEMTWFLYCTGAATGKENDTTISSAVSTMTRNTGSAVKNTSGKTPKTI